MSASAQAAADDMWSSLPGDLLGAVYNKISSPLARVRFKAVSKSWRAAASGQRPAPTAPWLVLSQYKHGTAERQRVCVFCPADGELLRVPLPPEAAGKRLVGFHEGGWVAAMSDVDGSGSLVIVNLFSGIQVPLSAKQRTIPTIFKLVFSEAPTSKHCILAAIPSHTIKVCTVGCRERGWWASKENYWFNDIAFYHGKLYGLARSVGKLMVFDVRMTKKGSPVITVTYHLGMHELPKHQVWVPSKHQMIFMDTSYMVKHNDKIFMALRVFWSPKLKPFFKVFELVNADTKGFNCRWEEVTTLDGHALFLSTTCCRAVRVPTGRRGGNGIEKDHIYYNHRCSTTEHNSICDDVHVRRCDNGDHLYHMGEQNLDVVDGIKSVGYYVAGGHHHTPGWLLPPEF